MDWSHLHTGRQKFASATAITQCTILKEKKVPNKAGS